MLIKFRPYWAGKKKSDMFFLWLQEEGVMKDGWGVRLRYGA